MIEGSTNNLFQSYSSLQKILKFTSVALVLRAIILAYFVHNSAVLFPERLIDGFFFKMNDYEYFLGSIDNYFIHGTITYLDQVKPFAGRMPGYGFPYLIIREFTDQSTGLAILGFLQIITSAFATYVLALTALLIFKSERFFKAVFWCFAISAPTIIFDMFTLSESFSISAIIFFHYFLLRYITNRKILHLFLSGLFLAWAIFLRPFLGLFIAVTPLFIFIQLLREKKSIGELIKINLIFLLPFIVFESAWVTRNYIALNRFIPLETSLSESYGEDGAYRTSAIGIRSLINAWGGETGEFYDGSEGWWFHNATGTEIKNYVFKPYVFNAGFTRDSLETLKYIFNESINHDRNASARDSLNMLANKIALRYAGDYKTHNFFRCHFINPVKMFSKLIFSNGTRLLILPPFQQMNFAEKAFKLFFAFYYYLILISGIAGMILFAARQKNLIASSTLLILYPWIIAVTLVFYASFVILEYRYIISAFPVFMLFGVYCLINLPPLKNLFSEKKIV